MKKDLSLKIIFWISVAGLIFSGYLSYGELFAKSCYSAILGMGECTNVFEIPACVYGFFMYALIFIFSLIGLRKDKK